MHKKKSKRISEYDILKSIRKYWPNGFNPVTNVKKSDKIYNRKKYNKKLQGGLQ